MTGEPVACAFCGDVDGPFVLRSVRLQFDLGFLCEPCATGQVA